MKFDRKGISRTAAKRFTLILVLLLALISSYIYSLGNDVRVEIDRKKQSADRLRHKIDTGNVYSTARADLDNLTLDENNSTTLAILRHLDLQESKLSYRTKSKTLKNINGTDINIRKFLLSGEASYQEILSQLDWLQTSKKAVLTKAVLRNGEGYGNSVYVEIEGLLYGLDKS
jgi:hypothetical protein|tara:strand:+ start:2669 stop:3187 length:519 start_codon:yes stop_codon:yes gene_type:complete